MKTEPWAFREGSGLHKHFESWFPSSQLISAVSAQGKSVHRLSRMDVTGLVLNQESPCSQSPFDPHFGEGPEIITDSAECGCTGLFGVRNPDAYL